MITFKIVTIIIILVIAILYTIYITVTKLKKKKKEKHISLSGGNTLDLLYFEPSTNKMHFPINITDKPPSKLTFKEIESTCLNLNKFYDENSSFKKKYVNISLLLQPIQRLFIKYDLVGKVQMTNAFIKLIEIVSLIDSQLLTIISKNNNELTHFDIASAPGMFVIALQHYYKHKYKDIKYNWKACSYIEKGTTLLGDDYQLFKKNPTRFINMDVTNEDNIKKCISKKDKYIFVTGDIGEIHGYDKLQEYDHFVLQYGQMILAINLCAKGGIIFLKMYTIITDNCIGIVKIIEKYFDKVMICKPRSSRIMNSETYILAFGRNDKDSSNELLTISNFSMHISDEERQKYYQFFWKLSHLRLYLVKYMIELLEKYKTVEEIRNSESYKKYSENFDTLVQLLKRISI